MTAVMRKITDKVTKMMRTVSDRRPKFYWRSDMFNVQITACELSEELLFKF